LALPEAATTIVNHLLDEEPLAVYEASVHRPQRSRVWVATFTGPSGGRIWRSTGMTDREQALALAKHWEAEARAQRVSLGRLLRKPILRVRGQKPGTGLLTQNTAPMSGGMKFVGLVFIEMCECRLTLIILRAVEYLKAHECASRINSEQMALPGSQRPLCQKRLTAANASADCAGNST
jgi:hypothetical protein